MLLRVLIARTLVNPFDNLIDLVDRNDQLM